MKKVFSLFLFSLSLNAFSQIYNFDSVKTVISSPSYDYKNPVFDVQRGDLFSSTWLAYERYKANGACDIIVRKVTFQEYETEIVLTSAVNDSNLHPCIFDKFIFWESNKDGNWNIYYSVYNGSNWSAPGLLPGSTAANETRPYLSFDYSYYPLVFKRGPDIMMKKYLAASSTWDTTEYNVTDSIAEDCSGPIINYDGNDFGITFFRQLSVSNYKLNYRRFHMYNNGVVSWLNRNELTSNIVPHTLKLSRGINFYYPMPTFDSGSVNKSVMLLYPGSSAGVTILSNPITGINSSGKGVLMGILFDKMLPYFSAFGCISRKNDSTFIALSRRYDATGSPTNLKRKYIGNSSANTAIDLSSPLTSTNFYKIRAVWERVINGKYALEESFMTDVLGEVINTGIGVNYNLSQNYPNPFNPSTRINYELKITNYVSLKVFNLLGKEVAQLVNEKQNAGSYAVDFNSSEFNLPSGIYFYTLNAGEFKETRKMVLVK